MITLQEQRDLARLQVSTLSMEVAALSGAKQAADAQKAAGSELETRLRGVKVSEFGGGAAGTLLARVPVMMAELLHLQACASQVEAGNYAAQLEAELQEHVAEAGAKHAELAARLAAAATHVSAAASYLDASMEEVRQRPSFKIFALYMQHINSPAWLLCDAVIGSGCLVVSVPPSDFTTVVSRTPQSSTAANFPTLIYRK